MSNSPPNPQAISKSPPNTASDHPPPQLQPIRPRLTSQPSQSSLSPPPPLESRPLRSKRSPVLAACNCKILLLLLHHGSRRTPPQLADSPQPVVRRNLGFASRLPVRAESPKANHSTTQCDGKRPSCGPCLRVEIDCAYSVPEGLTVREAQKRKLDETAGANDDYQSIVRLLRHGSEDDAQAAFRRLREAGSVQGTVRSLADASLLLLPAASSSSRPTTTPTQQRDSPLMLNEPQPPIENPPPLLESAPRFNTPWTEKPTPERASSRPSVQQGAAAFWLSRPTWLLLC